MGALTHRFVEPCGDEAAAAAQRQGALGRLVPPGRGLGPGLSGTAAVRHADARRAPVGARPGRGRGRGDGRGRQGGLRPARRSLPPQAADRDRLRRLGARQTADRAGRAVGRRAGGAVRRSRRQGDPHLAARRADRRRHAAGDPRPRVRLPPGGRQRRRGRRPAARAAALRGPQPPAAPAVPDRRRPGAAERRLHRPRARAPAGARRRRPPPVGPAARAAGRLLARGRPARALRAGRTSPTPWSCCGPTSSASASSASPSPTPSTTCSSRC